MQYRGPHVSAWKDGPDTTYWPCAQTRVTGVVPRHDLLALCNHNKSFDHLLSVAEATTRTYAVISRQSAQECEQTGLPRQLRGANWRLCCTATMLITQEDSKQLRQGVCDKKTVTGEIQNVPSLHFDLRRSDLRHDHYELRVYLNNTTVDK